MENVLYLGREDYYEFETNYNDGGFYSRYYANKGKKHIFVYIDNGKTGYWVQSGFTKIASKISDVISTDFPEQYEKFKQSFNGSPVTKITFEECEPVICNQYGYARLANNYETVIMKGGKYYNYNADRITSDSVTIHASEECTIVGDKLMVAARNYNNSYYYGRNLGDTVRIQDLKLYVPTIHNEYGNTHKIR
jgi:hypothetical protein